MKWWYVHNYLWCKVFYAFLIFGKTKIFFMWIRRVSMIIFQDGHISLNCAFFFVCFLTLLPVFSLECNEHTLKTVLPEFGRARRGRRWWRVDGEDVRYGLQARPVCLWFEVSFACGVKRPKGSRPGEKAPAVYNEITPSSSPRQPRYSWVVTFSTVHRVREKRASRREGVRVREW